MVKSPGTVPHESKPESRRARLSWLAIFWVIIFVAVVVVSTVLAWRYYPVPVPLEH